MIVSGSLLELAQTRIDAGALDLEDPKIQKALPVLEEFAAAALEAGVRHSWKDWVQFTALEQRAWVNAARKVATQEARRSALAMRGEVGYLMAGVDNEPDAMAQADDALADGWARKLASSV